VIQALDELKKFNPGAREAIKYLEQELKKGNRYNLFILCLLLRPISAKEKFPWTENFPKISLLKVENFGYRSMFRAPI
jgi:hypothetical protein